MKRYQLMHFVDVKMGKDTADYRLLGDGIESLTEEFNVESETTQWINMKDGTTRNKGYTPSVSVERANCIDDEVTTWINKLIDTLPTGADCETTMVRVRATGSKGPTGYPAIRRKVAVAVGSTGGDAGDDVKDAITLGGVGDSEEGTFDPETREFTPA